MSSYKEKHEACLDWDPIEDAVRLRGGGYGGELPKLGLEEFVEEEIVLSRRDPDSGRGQSSAS